MITLIVILLVVFWLAGIISIPSFSVLHRALFFINRNPVSFLDLLLLSVFIWVIGVLPSPLRGIGMVLLVLWLLAILGVIAITGLSNLIIILLIIGLILHMSGITLH